MAYRIVTTVTEAATSGDLIALSTVKAELDIDGAAKDDLLKQYVSAASAAISQHCNRTFALEGLRDEIWPLRGPHAYQLPTLLPSLQLSRWPVSSSPPVSVEENGVALEEGAGFRIEPKSGLVYRLDGTGYPMAWSAWPIVVAYKAGFEQIPPDVADAALRMVTARFRAKGRDPFVRQDRIPDVRDVSYWIATGADAGNMTPDVVDLLENYRVPVMA